MVQEDNRDQSERESWYLSTMRACRDAADRLREARQNIIIAIKESWKHISKLSGGHK